MTEEIQEMKWYPYGHDFGNTIEGGVLIKSGQQLRKSIPTAFLRADTSAMKNLGVNVDAENMHIIQMKDESTSYAFGDLALAQGVEVWTGRDDEGRYASHYSLKGLLVNAATQITDKEFGLLVVTGLPADQFIKHPGLRDQIKQRLHGVHCFTLNGGTTWRTAHVEVGTVVMEGAGALIATGAIQNKTTEAGVIDIGGGTTDLYVQRGNIPVTEFCKGKRLGVEAAQALLMATFEKKYSPRVLTILEARAIMHGFVSGKIKDFPQISVYGQSVPATELQAMTCEAVEQVSGDIVSFVSSAWRQAGGAARFDPVLLIGGGYFYFYRSLKERIRHLEGPEDPTHANAVGYATLAARMLLKRNQDLAAAKKAEREAAAAAERETAAATTEATAEPQTSETPASGG